VIDHRTNPQGKEEQLFGLPERSTAPLQSAVAGSRIDRSNRKTMATTSLDY